MDVSIRIGATSLSKDRQMADCKIKCEVVNISHNKSVCPSSSQAKMGKVLTIGGKTPGGMCARTDALICHTDRHDLKEGYVEEHIS